MEKEVNLAPLSPLLVKFGVEHMRQIEFEWRNVLETYMNMNCFIQIIKCLRFTIFIRGAQAAAPPQPRLQLRHYRGSFFFFFFFTSCDEAHLNGESLRNLYGTW